MTQFNLIEVVKIEQQDDFTLFHYVCDFLEGDGPEESVYVWRPNDEFGAADQTGIYNQLRAWWMSNPDFPVTPYAPPEE